MNFFLIYYTRRKVFYNIQSTPDNSNLQGKSKKFQVIGNPKKIAGSKEKNSFYCIVNILITFTCVMVFNSEEMSSENIRYF